MVTLSQKVHPFLWFNTEAEEAARFYISVIPGSKILDISRYPEGSPGPEGSVMVVSFSLGGMEVSAMNGGPHYKLSPAFSLMVSCKDQAELDELWAKLTADGGQEVQCGWLEDKFGVSWQLMPESLPRLVAPSKSDPGRHKRVLEALWSMVKIDIAALQRAYDGK